jgi:hypothetical protein
MCLSHVRWNRVHQRPQILMQRCARDRRVVFFEEPLHDVAEAELELRGAGLVIVAVPHIPPRMSAEHAQHALRLMAEHAVQRAFSAPPVLWYYTPAALPYTRDITARAVIYDCVDPAIVRGSPLLDAHAQGLLRRADVVFTRERGFWHHPFAYAPDATGDDVWEDMWLHVERAVSRRAAVRQSGIHTQIGSAARTIRAARRDD